MRVLVGGIGYRNLADHSFGILVIEALAGRRWPDGVSVEDLSYGPIAVVQRLEDVPADARFDRLVVVAAVERVGRPAGTLTVYRWDGALPATEEIQAAVAEAVTGVIFMDNTLVVAQHFGVLPRDVIVVECQPGRHEFGDELSDDVAAAVSRACETIAVAATDPAFAARLPVLPLGGGSLRIPGSFWPQVTDVRSRAH